MNIEDCRNHCLALKGTTESFPFGPDTLVFKVMDKMYALTNVDLFQSINLKCDPDEAMLLREKYSCVIPGYHMNKKHWNTILNDGTVPDKLIYSWIDASYQLVVAGLSIKHKKMLEEL